MEKTGTPIDLKDIKPGDVLRVEWKTNATDWTVSGAVVKCVNDGIVVFHGDSDRATFSLPSHSTYYLLSRPEKTVAEKVIDKEELKLGQRVRIEAGERVEEGVVAALSREYYLLGGALFVVLGRDDIVTPKPVFYFDAITRVVLLS